MSSVEPTAALPTPPKWTGRRRLRLAAFVVAGVIVAALIALGALWYFTYCGNCSRPILCPDPCNLPHYS